jgi:hypothetical protein
MKTGMTLAHKCFVTQFSTKEVLCYDDFLKNYWKFVISYRWTVLNYFVPTKTRSTYICTRCSRAIWAFGGWWYAGSYLQVWRQTDANWHDSGPQMFRHTIFDKRGAILWWLFKELLKVFTWLVGFPYQLSIISALIRKYIGNYILQGVTTLWYNIHLQSYAVSYKNCLITNIFAHLTRRKVPNFLHYYVWHKPSSKWHTDTVFVQIPTFVFCFCLFVCFFSILTNLYIYFETGKITTFVIIFRLFFCLFSASTRKYLDLYLRGFFS